MSAPDGRVKRPYKWSAAELAKRRERMKALNADPEFKARMKALHAEQKALIRAARKAGLAPDYGDDKEQA